MTGISFEKRAVAFIDVLGFGQLVDRAAAEPPSMVVLDELVTLLSKAIPMFDSTVEKSVPWSDIPKHLYVSDSIILSAPMVAAGTGYDGLSTVVMRCIQVSQLLLSKGFLVRGGIDVGEAWHAETKIVGPGYQGAYNIEKGRPDPGIQLSGEAAAHWGAGRLSASTMCIRCDEDLIVNPLEEFYFADGNAQYIDDTYRSFATIVEANLLSLPPRAGAKWEWFQRLLNRASGKTIAQ